MKNNKVKKIGFYLVVLFLFVSACKLFVPQENSPTLTETPPVLSTATALPLKPRSESIGDPFAPELGSADYDAQQYHIQINLDPALRDYVEAEVEILAVSLQDQLSEMALDFIGFEIENLTVNGMVSNFERVGDKLVIEFFDPVPFDQSIIVNIQYQGEIIRRPSRYIPFEDSVGMFFPDPDSIFIASEPDGARFWFPCNDHPRDKATYRIEITTPSKYLAASNGRLIETEELTNGNTRFVWEHNFPMASYLATIIVGDYERFEQSTAEGILIRDYIFSDSNRSAFDAFAETPEMLTWLESMLGPYPFDTYGHATVNAPGFSLETQTLVMMSNQMLSKDVVIHEMVHMWFGDWVSLKSWGEMWRNEGFATYFSWYWFYRDNLELFNQEMERRTDEVFHLANLEALGDLSSDNLFSYETYIKGGVMVHALRTKVGEEAFFSGLKLYFERFGGETASDEEFKEIMEETSGMNLDDFFIFWLNN